MERLLTVGTSSPGPVGLGARSGGPGGRRAVIDLGLAGSGPMRRTDARLGDDDREALRADPPALVRELEMAGRGTIMPREALLTTAVARCEREPADA